MRFAYGARNASVEEDAFRKGSCDKRRVLEAALCRGNRIAGVRDKPLGGIVKSGAGAEERFHASRAKEFRLILERTLEEVDGIPERLRLRHAALADHLDMAIVGCNVGNCGTRRERAKSPNPQNCHDHRKKLRFGSRDGRGKLKVARHFETELHACRTLLRPEGVSVVDVVAFEEHKPDCRRVVGASHWPCWARPARRHGAGITGDTVAGNARDSSSNDVVWRLHRFIVIVVVCLRRGAAERDTALVKCLAHRVLIAPTGGYRSSATGACVGSQRVGADDPCRSSSDGQISHSGTGLVSLNGNAGSFRKYDRTRWRRGSRRMGTQSGRASLTHGEPNRMAALCEPWPRRIVER